MADVDKVNREIAEDRIEITPAAKKGKKVVRKELTDDDRKHLSMLNKLKKDRKLDDTKIINDLTEKDYDYIARGMVRALVESRVPETIHESAKPTTVKEAVKEAVKEEKKEKKKKTEKKTTRTPKI
jgi:hypothetical protein